MQEANTALSKRRRAKKTRLQDRGAIDGSQAREIMAEKGIVKVEERVKEENKGLSKRRRTGTRLYNIYRKTGHNIKIYPDIGSIDSLNNSK